MTRRLPRSGWMLAGVLAALVLLPTAASAAASVFVLRGPSGMRADVTKANQLKTAEASPSTFTQFRLSLTAGGCSTLGVVPADTGMVLRQVEVVPASYTSQASSAVIFDGPNCTGSRIATAAFYSLQAGHSGEGFTFEPGFALAPGTTLSVQLPNLGMSVDIYAMGYRVPAADVPQTTP
jgi:hypothetical protein